MEKSKDLRQKWAEDFKEAFGDDADYAAIIFATKCENAKLKQQLHQFKAGIPLIMGSLSTLINEVVE